MAVIKLSKTFTADGTAVLETSGDSSLVNIKLGKSGVLLDVRVSAVTETTATPSITDATGTVFTAASADFTTAVQYKNDNAAIVRNSVTGQLSGTVTGIASGSVTITAWVKYD